MSMRLIERNSVEVQRENGMHVLAEHTVFAGPWETLTAGDPDVDLATHEVRPSESGAGIEVREVSRLLVLRVHGNDSADGASFRFEGAELDQLARNLALLVDAVSYSNRGARRR